MGRGRDSGCPLPPAQSRAGAVSAHGSYLGCLASKRTLPLPAHGPAHLVWVPDSVFGPGFVGPCSPWSAAFPPQPPLAVSRLVRLLRRYYATVRLPATVPGGLMAHRFLPPVRGFPAADNDGASRFSRVEFLCLRGVFDSAGPRCTRATAHRVIAFG